MSKLVVVAALCSLLGYANSGAAQGLGSVTGTVHDQKTGEELVGANVVLVGTSLGASADLDGKFTIRNVPPGPYDVRVSYIGYTPKVVQALTVRADQATTLDVALGQEVAEAKEEVVVTAERVLSTEAAVLSERKKSATIGDAVSAEQIKRSPDATSSDALKRVTGLTIVDDKFVFVRGVTDRYNATSLNGTSVTSTDTDVDRKSFSFDLVPSNLLENTVVVKTATPDLPGDFSGGLVQVNTLDFPTSRTIRLSLSSALDASTTRKTMFAAPAGGHDWLGRDDGSRALPGGNLTGNALAHELHNTWQLRSLDAPFDNAASLAVGDRHPIGNDELGYVGALSYRNTYQTSSFELRPSFQGVPLLDFTGDRYKRAVLWGGLLNLNYKLRGLNKLSFRNNYNQSAQEKVIVSSGLPTSGEFTRKQVAEWDERSFYLSQLAGEHKIPALGGLVAEWKGFYSKSRAEEPDRKQASYERASSGAFALRENYRTWSTLDETSRGANTDLAWSHGRSRIKTGAAFERRARDYGIRAFATDASHVVAPNYDLLVLPIERVFAPENYGAGKFSFVPVTTFTGEYDGRQDVRAGYAMADEQLTLLGRGLRVVGGVRVEDAEILVHSIAQTGDPRPVTVRVANTDWLPSANLTWVLGDELNCRLAYGRSVNRPEFRELADVLYLDFDAEQNVIGNPDLKRARIDNYDARLEYFPNPGEVLAASVFYKQLDNAIEERLLPSPERFVRTWFNSPDGKNYGYELEARKSLGLLGAPLRGFSLTGNYTRIKSSISYTETRTGAGGGAVTTERERVMQGQSPWSANVSLLYAAPPRFGTSVNVLYGKVGRRLQDVGDSRDEDVYEESRDLLDIAVTQKFLRRYDAKFAIKNVLGEDEVLTSGREKSTFSRISRGTAYSLAFAMGL